jgi:tetratricopeptide (TPR) repeat protein
MFKLQLAVEKSGQNQDLAISYYYIAFGYRLLNEPTLSIEYARKALEVITRLIEISPETIYYIRSVAIIKPELAVAFLMVGETDKAFNNLQNAAAKLEKAVAADNSVLGFQAELANTYRFLAKAFYKKGERRKALEFIDKASAIVSKLKFRNNLIYAERNLLDELESEKANYNFI